MITKQRHRRTRKTYAPERLDALRYLDAEACVRIAPIAKRTFYQYIADGKLPAFRIGGTGKIVVRREDFERFLSATPIASKLDRIVEETMRDLGAKE